MKIINKNLKLFLISLSLMALASCTTIQIGKDFRLQSFTKNAELGKTTQNQIFAWLGKPMSSGISVKEDGQRLVEWFYFYGNGKLPNMENAKIKTLQIRLNKGILQSYNSTGDN